MNNANKPTVTVKETTYEMVYQIKGDCNIGAWISKKHIEQYGLAIAFDIKCDQLERMNYRKTLQIAREVRKALGL